jgi:hypothetical protein
MPWGPLIVDRLLECQIGYEVTDAVGRSQCFETSASQRRSEIDLELPVLGLRGWGHPRGRVPARKVVHEIVERFQGSREFGFPSDWRIWDRLEKLVGGQNLSKRRPQVISGRVSHGQLGL